MSDIDTSPAALRALAESLITPRLGETATVHFKALSMVKAADFLRAVAAEKEAAPELLNALKAALPVVLSAPESTPGLDGRIQAIEAALAKVKGQS